MHSLAADRVCFEFPKVIFLSCVIFIGLTGKALHSHPHLSIYLSDGYLWIPPKLYIFPLFCAWRYSTIIWCKIYRAWFWKNLFAKKKEKHYVWRFSRLFFSRFFGLLLWTLVLEFLKFHNIFKYCQTTNMSIVIYLDLHCWVVCFLNVTYESYEGMVW